MIPVVSFMQVAMEKFILGVIIFLVSSVVIAIGIGIYFIIQASNAPTFELRKDQWKCTETTSYYTTTNILVGKVIVPQTQRVTECINYQRYR